jgi:hypothetical protein
MRKKLFILVVVFVMASLLAGCSLPASKAPVITPLSEQQISQIVDEAIAEQGPPIVNVTVPEQPAPVINIEVPEQPAPVVNVTMPEVKPEEPATQESVVDLILPDCPLEDQGRRIEFTDTLEKEDGFYNLSSSMEQLEEYSGCNVLIEGRIQLVEEHHIWVYFPGEWELAIREGSLWVYPESWNISDFSTEKPPISAEFVSAKRNNQIANNYDWIIYVHEFNELDDREYVYIFPAGQPTPLVTLPDNANFPEPRAIVVQGVWDGVFNASIGAEKATTIALLDEELFFWVGAQDNIIFQTVEAWLMPSSWSQDQIENWAEAQFPGKTLGAYAP